MDTLKTISDEELAREMRLRRIAEAENQSRPVDLADVSSVAMRHELAARGTAGEIDLSAVADAALFDELIRRVSEDGDDALKLAIEDCRRARVP